MLQATHRTLCLFVALLACAGGAWADTASSDGGVLAGRVETSAAPLSTARVYAYAMGDLSLRKVVTDREGLFLFDQLPGGLYKIIAFKQGFVPAIVMLSRASQSATQFLEVELNAPPASNEKASASFWAIREEIPPDVLRDMAMPVFETTETAPRQADTTTGLQTEMRAITGVHEGLDVGDAQVNGAQVGLQGQLRDLSIAVRGEFTQLDGQSLTPSSSNSPSGSTQALAVSVSAEDGSKVDFSSSTNRLVGQTGRMGGAGGPDSVDFARHNLSWSRALGQRAHSSVSAQYVEERNFYRQGAVYAPDGIPEASRAWRLQGAYQHQLTPRSSIEAGVLYRERASDFLNEDGTLPEETVELFGKAGWQAKPAVVVQYGLYSALHDGTVSLAPQGGVVLQLSQNWQASTTASRRIDTESDPYRRIDFTPTYYRDARDCGRSQEYCYEFSVSRNASEDREIKLGASHRKIGETQRMFFDADFFDRLDSLYLVDGDRLPELSVEVTRRLSPNILTRIESNVASGGGGLMHTVDSSYENEVRYLVTSMDTRFEESDTGLYFAFHRLEQELNPVRRADEVQALALERLQLGVSQDLGFLDQLASDLALHLNMELSRGGTTEELFDQLRKRITGGVAVRF